MFVLAEAIVLVAPGCFALQYKIEPSLPVPTGCFSCNQLQPFCTLVPPLFSQLSCLMGAHSVPTSPSPLQTQVCNKMCKSTWAAASVSARQNRAATTHSAFQEVQQSASTVDPIAAPNWSLSSNKPPVHIWTGSEHPTKPMRWEPATGRLVTGVCRRRPYYPEWRRLPLMARQGMDCWPPQAGSWR